MEGGAVLAEGGVANEMVRLDLPMGTNEEEEFGRGDVGMAGDPVDGLHRGGGGGEFGHRSGETKGLTNIRKVQFGSDVVGDGGSEQTEFADLETAVGLIDRAGRSLLRGKKSRQAGRTARQSLAAEGGRGARGGGGWPRRHGGSPGCP